MIESARSENGLLRGVGIGAGYFSQFHYEAWQRIPEATIMAIADLDEEKARVTAARFGIPRFYTDYEEMLNREEPDFADIITPPESHFEISTRAARSGIHVICQKPLAPTYQMAQQLVKEVQESGVRFMVHENWRWQPWYREIKRLQSDGVLEDVFSISFCLRTGDGRGDDAYLDRQPYFREYPRFFMYETGVHFIDTFRYLLGEVNTVYARLCRLNPVIAGEDSAVVVLNFKSGSTAILDANRYNELDSDAPVRYTFGSMRLDARNSTLRLEPDGSMHIKPHGESSYELQYPHVDRGLAGDSCFYLQNHFVHALTHEEDFESEGADYLKTLRVVEACYESSAREQVVRLDTSDEENGTSPGRSGSDQRVDDLQGGR